MLFEGSEKKVEIVVGGEQNLLSLGDAYWHELVKRCNAQILSQISTPLCKAYLLSESSLFVWENRFTLITCGVTTLVQSIDYFMETFKGPLENIIFERKNEHFPHKQTTSFYQDVELISEKTKGKSFLFGDLTDHHLFLFHNKSLDFKPPSKDVTLEILMYDLQGEAKAVFENQNLTAQEIRSRTGVGQIFDNFIVDDFKFEPCGYSLNALKDDYYYTIHVTPQEIGSYVSFETNIKLEGSYSKVVERVIDIFKPRSFDVVVFKTDHPEYIDVKNYGALCAQHQSLECGYEVFYSQFRQGAINQVSREKFGENAKDISEIRS